MVVGSSALAVRGIFRMPSELRGTFVVLSVQVVRNILIRVLLL